MAEMSLIEAVKTGDPAAVKTLIESGVDLDQQDTHGWTPLNWAAGSGDVYLVGLLLEKGADVFKTGQDRRTPYMIALAAGRVDVTKLLREAEDKTNGGKANRFISQYCKAYHLKELRRFVGWTENRIKWTEKERERTTNDNPREEPKGFSDDDIVFIHQDHTVTQSIWHNENIVFNQVTPEWKEFCTSMLQFTVPDELDLVHIAPNSAEETKRLT